ncbi:MAG: aspartate/glutamate racemase family protein [Gammaproteobacteria bacterium]|nr:aspartate/glutamate racemase family protein [Gammaproteobacteria bacterium]
MDPRRITVIHATEASMAPVTVAFDRNWSEAELTHILDDGLSRDRQRQPQLTDDLRRRIHRLAAYAADCGAEAVLFACSAFGDAIEAAAQRLAIPVLKPNEAMFRAALDCGDELALFVTFEPAGPAMAAEFGELADRTQPSARLTTVYVPGALDALRRGDESKHNSLIAAAAGRVSGADAIMLGQFSMACANADCESAASVPVFTSPDAAVGQLRSLLHGN